MNADLPSPPLSPVILPQSLTSVLLSWIPPNNSICVISYTVSLINVTEGNVPYVYNTPTNTTNMTVSDLIEGVEYSFIVAGVDKGGRVGENSVLAQFITLDGEGCYVGIAFSADSITTNWFVKK